MTEEPEIVIGSREQLFHLLAEAAEIEHVLMCSYLFAAFSLKDEQSEGWPPSQAEAVARWRKAIMDVAIQEMGHLLIVSNLISAIGGRPHLGRPNFPVSAGYFPSGVTLTLSPFSAATIKHFVFLERPTGVVEVDGEGFEAQTTGRQQATIGLMPSAQDYATVSHLYEAIRANLIAVAGDMGERNLFVGSRHSQLGPSSFKMDECELITDLQTAFRAIDIIIEQGEGAADHREQSHYNTFSKIDRELAELLKNDPSFAPAYPVADSPVMRHNGDMTGKVFVDAQPAASLLDFGNAVYGFLLRLLVQTFAYGEEVDAAHKQKLMMAALDMMHCLGRIASELPKLSASSTLEGANAGITFTMLRSIEPFIPGDIERRLIHERLTAMHETAKSLATGIPALHEVDVLLWRQCRAFEWIA